MLEKINKLVNKCVSMNSTDIHLTSGKVPWVRINGLIQKLEDEDIITHDEIKMFIDEMKIDKKKLEYFSINGDLDIGYSNDEGNYRLNFYMQNGLLACAIRILPREIPAFDTLGIPPILIDLIKERNGLILVTGATGNGKSTTLASLLNIVNLTEQKHIITIEDPIEYHYPYAKSLINQREIGSDCISFASAFKAALREDPDIILIGELRDKETIQTAINAAESGHLVISTLHTNSASETIERITSYFDGGEQKNISDKLANALRGIICQSLISRCDKEGLVCACEVMLPVVSIKSLIRDNKFFQIDSFIKLNKINGMITMEDSLADLVKANKISIEEGKRVAKDKNYYESCIRQRNIKISR